MHSFRTADELRFGPVIGKFQQQMDAGVFPADGTDPGQPFQLTHQDLLLMAVDLSLIHILIYIVILAFQDMSAS